MTKQQYAARYDALAPACYRFALWTLGEPAAAAQALSAAFRAGYSALGSGDAFEVGFLTLLWAECARVPPIPPADGIGGGADPTPEGWLAGLWRDERGLLLLASLFGCDAQTLAAITGQPPLRVWRRCRLLTERSGAPMPAFDRSGSRG
ncbi:MAG: hypothetical protein RRY21_05160 [Oscillospiraceae bacterium]